MTKFLKVLLDWLFVPHGYLDWSDTPGYGAKMDIAAVALAQRIGGKPKLNKCKVCGKQFYALKQLPTCKGIRCFFSYRLKKRGKK